MQILIVEDMSTFAADIAEALMETGYDVDIVPDAETALSCLIERSYDAVISDAELPGRSGIELLCALRRQRLNTPTIILAHLLDYRSFRLASQAGATAICARGKGCLEELVLQLDRNLRRGNDPS